MISDEDRLSFCNVCLNRSKDGEFIICGLTDTAAVFESSCKDFKLDSEESQNLQTEIDLYYKKINDKTIPLPEEFNFEINDWKFTNIKQFENHESGNLILQDLPIQFIPQTKKLLLPILIFLVMIFGLLFFDPNKTIKSAFIEKPDAFRIVMFSALFLTPFILIYKLFDKRPVLTFTNEGLVTKTEKIFWHRILSTYLLEAEIKGAKCYSLIIHRYEEYDPIIIEISSLNATPQEIVKGIETLKRKFKKN